MQELTPKQIHQIEELQNEMAIEGHNIPWDRCVEAYWKAEEKKYSPEFARLEEEFLAARRGGA